MGEIVLLQTGNRAPDDLPLRLRELADKVDAGDITAAVVGYIDGGEYDILWGASLVDSLTLASLMQDSAIRKFRNE